MEPVLVDHLGLPRDLRRPFQQSIEGPQVRFNLHDLQILDLRRHIVATLNIKRADAGAVSTRQRTATPYSRDVSVERDGDDALDGGWRCGERWSGVGHVLRDIPGVRFVEIPGTLSAWDVLDPR